MDGNRLYESAEVEKSNNLTKISGDNDFFVSPKGRIQIVMDVKKLQEKMIN